MWNFTNFQTFKTINAELVISSVRCAIWLVIEFVTLDVFLVTTSFERDKLNIQCIPFHLHIRFECQLIDWFRKIWNTMKKWNDLGQWQVLMIFFLAFFVLSIVCLFKNFVTNQHASSFFILCLEYFGMRIQETTFRWVFSLKDDDELNLIMFHIKLS